MAVIKTNPEKTPTIEGVEHGATISLILDRSNPGQGPKLHRHPYDETWLVLDGTVNFQAGNETRAAGPGDVVIVPANTPHKFTNDGPGPLKARVHPRQPHRDRRMAGIAVVRPRTAWLAATVVADDLRQRWPAVEAIDQAAPGWPAARASRPDRTPGWREAGRRCGPPLCTPLSGGSATRGAWTRGVAVP